MPDINDININDIPKIYDISLEGMDASKKLLDVWNNEAFINSLRIWLASFTGETIHSPNSGGFVTQFLVKPMNQVDLVHFKTAIKMGLTNDFKPPVIINYINIIPNYAKRYWTVELSVYSPTIQQTINLSEKMKSYNN